MKVREINTFLISIPLNRRKKISTRAINSREYLVVKVTAENGLEGWGYTFGTEIELSAARKVLSEMVIGKDIWCTEAIWNHMYKATVRWGRRGAVLRAISAIDIALWDIKAKMASVPLYKLLGGASHTIKVYKSGGYYTELEGEEDLDYIRNDCHEAIAKNYGAYKLRVGLNPKHDIKRVEVARETLGNEFEIFVDANNGWDINTALSFGRELEKLNVGWFEEPTLPDDLVGLARIARELDIPIAIGELEATRWAFQNIIDSKSADILQPDVTVLGGVTEWMKVVNLATSQGIVIVPHAFHEIHMHLACAIPEVRMVEFFELEADAINIGKILNGAPRVEKGHLECPDKPGLGYEIDEDHVRYYAIG